jgi:hypothetical protein
MIRLDFAKKVLQPGGKANGHQRKITSLPLEARVNATKRAHVKAP